jgi:hypothetical protein
MCRVPQVQATVIGRPAKTKGKNSSIRNSVRGKRVAATANIGQSRVSRKSRSQGSGVRPERHTFIKHGRNFLCFRPNLDGRACEYSDKKGALPVL